MLSSLGAYAKLHLQFNYTELQQLLATGGQPNVHWLKNGPWFAPLKGYPAFETILADPKNNAPLF